MMMPNRIQKRSQHHQTITLHHVLTSTLKLLVTSGLVLPTVCYISNPLSNIDTIQWIPSLSLIRFVEAAHSINYGIGQQSITDVGQLMPRLCQNQESICEGSFGVCINRVKRCICDLRMPVQLGRFCLRQVDLDTKCFATSQCNHTIKDAVCMDINTNLALDYSGSNSKLEQWHKLNELKQMSQSTLANSENNNQIVGGGLQVARRLRNRQAPPVPNDGTYDSWGQSLRIESSDNTMVSNSRSSPYELSFTTSELMVQNHTTTRQRANFSDRIINEQISNAASRSQPNLIPKEKYHHPTAIRSSSTTTTTTGPTTTITTTTTTQESILSGTSSTGGPFDPVTRSSDSAQTVMSELATSSTARPTPGSSSLAPQTSASAATTTTTTTTDSYELTSSQDTPPALSSNSERRVDEPSQRASVTSRGGSLLDQPAGKKIIKTVSWPPGLCSCSTGFMFDPMVRKCLALSLADSHCLSDADCRQIVNTHCSVSLRKCECDEPLAWEQVELACLRPKALSKGDTETRGASGGLVDSLVISLIAAKLFPNQTVLLFCFLLVIVLATLILLRLTVKCFSSSSSALISPKGAATKKRRLANKSRPGDSDNLTGPSPYATLRRPDHKPSSQLSNFTRATRGRILNYDFEQESPTKTESASRCQSPQQQHHSSGSLASLTLKRATSSGAADKDTTTRGLVSGGATGTIRSIKSHKQAAGQNQHQHDVDSNYEAPPKANGGRPPLEETNGMVELNDNISVSQAESEEHSVLSIPGPPPGQQPPYMMKGQGSAIAAAAAAVANKRILAAQKKKLEHAAGCLNGASSGSSVAAGFANRASPVYL